MGLCVVKKFWNNNWVILVALLVMAGVIGFYFFQFSPYDLSKDLCINTTGDEADCLSKDATRWGTFGDFFGGTLNPILSFLALFVVLKTYLSQQKELKETQDILKEQSETQKRQRFENTFFELLKIHNAFLEGLEGDSTTVKEITEGIKKDCTYAGDNSTDDSKACKDKKLEFLCLATRRLRTKKLHGTYFRVLYELLKFIAINSGNRIDSKFKDDDIALDDVGANEKMYSNIIRAMLPDNVMRLLAINCYSEKNDKDDYWKYKLLVERYIFFEHASFKEDFENAKNEQSVSVTDKVFKNVKEFYEPKAFGK